MELERRGRRRNNEKKQNMFESATPKSFVCDSFSGEPRGVQAALQLHPEARRLQPLSFQHSLARPGPLRSVYGFCVLRGPGCPGRVFQLLSQLPGTQTETKKERKRGNAQSTRHVHFACAGSATRAGLCSSLEVIAHWTISSALIRTSQRKHKAGKGMKSPKKAPQPPPPPASTDVGLFHDLDGALLAELLGARAVHGTPFPTESEEKEREGGRERD